MQLRGYDLHVHSVHSDGLYSPMQLLELARRSGLAGIAITDHDVLPSADAMAAAALAGAAVRWIEGVELSCEFEGKGVHLLAYRFSLGASPVAELTESLQAARRDRIGRYIEALCSRSSAALCKRLETVAARQSPGRRHLARALVEVRMAPTLGAAFQRFLQPLAERIPWSARPELADAVRIVHESGGIAVIAHPPACWGEDVWDNIRSMGVDGIETSFPACKGTRRRKILEAAERCGFVQMGGSDYHGDGPADYLGRCHLESLPTQLNGSATA